MRISYLTFGTALAFCLSMACEVQTKKVISKHNLLVGSSYNHLFRNVFRETCFATGNFLLNAPDSVEADLWMYTKLDTSAVFFGKFSDGMPINEWQFVLNDGRQYSSNWNVYNNKMTACRFSLPFDYKETIVDSSTFHLATTNDSLGKVSIILGINPPILEEEKVIQFAARDEEGLVQQGFTFTKTRLKIKNEKATYYFTEFFMKSPVNKNVKYYHFYGNMPSGSKFVEFSLYHDGPKDDLVKLILELVLNHLYVNNERFYNPYLKQNKN